MVALAQYGKMKKTKIAMVCRINYEMCVSYLKWLEILGLIKIEIDEERFELFGLNSRGMDLCRKEFIRDQIHLV